MANDPNIPDAVTNMYQEKLAAERKKRRELSPEDMLLESARLNSQLASGSGGYAKGGSVPPSKFRYNGKDKGFGKRFASGGDVPADPGNVTADEAANIRAHQSAGGIDPVEQMRKAAKWREDFYAKNPTSD